MESLTKEIALYEKRKKNREYKAKQREAKKSKKKEVTIMVDNETLGKRAVCKARKERERTKCTIESCERHDNSDAFQNDVSHKKQCNDLNNAIYRANLGEYKLMQRRISNAQNMAFVRANQTDNQRILRNAQMARQVTLRRFQESYDETEQRREANARYMATARIFLNDDEVNQIRIKETQNRLLKDSRIEESEDPNVEEQVEIQYWFPNNCDPNLSNSVFHSQTEFIDAFLKDKEPTLIYNSRNYVADYRITLPTLFPLHFPFRTGRIEEDRRNRVLVGECLKHFLRLSLPMFQRSDFILVIFHMYFRSKSFQSAYLKCMSGSSLYGLR
jgi:hypothetical protein